MLATLYSLGKRKINDPLTNSTGLIGLEDKLNWLGNLQWPDYKLTEGRFVVFDSETTGLYSAMGDEIISLGGMVLDEGGFTGSCFFQMVNPYRNIPNLATKITGITGDMVLNAPDILIALDRFLRFSGRNILLGHCTDFDLGFINSKLLKYCGTKLSVPVLDTCWISQILYPNRRDHSLDSLAMTYGIPLTGRHTALGDCLITALLFFAMVQDLAEIGVFTTSQLLAKVQFWQRLRLE